MELNDVIVNQPVVIDNVNIFYFVTKAVTVCVLWHTSIFTKTSFRSTQQAVEIDLDHSHFIIPALTESFLLVDLQITPI